MDCWPKLKLSFFCASCGFEVTDIPWEGGELCCPKCRHALIRKERHLSLKNCPLCLSSHLYRQKDFNQKIGIGVVALGIAAAFFTYGMSLVLAALLDWWVYHKVGWVGICYQCQAQFRGKGVEKLPPFNLELFDYYKNLSPDSIGS